jgi:hypothetical protein
MQVGPDPAHPTGDFLKRGRLYQDGLSGSRVIRKPRDENIDCCYRLPMVEQPERRSNRLSWIAFLGGIGLLGVAILVSMLDIVRELVSTAIAIVGVAGMIYGVAAGALVATSRDARE